MPRRSPSRRRPTRRGVTLLEVLVSIFVILGGMLGVAALLPVGRFEMSMCLRADRAAAAGRAALREAQVRGMLDPATWVFAPGVTPTYDNPVAIDPLGFAAGVNGWFPVPQGPSPISVPRVTLASLAAPPLPDTRKLLAEEVFNWQDDLAFDFPGEKALRPRQILRYVDGSTGTNLVPGTLTAERDNKYSWMMTVVPADNESGLDASTRKLYTLSVVVFYGRMLTADGELSCGVTPTGPLLGGGDVLLRDWAAVDVKPREWILLRAGNVVGGNLVGVPRFKWYRVVAADEFDPQTNSRRVTLAGPDWTDIATGYNVVQAGIFPGAIGVYTETVELER